MNKKSEDDCNKVREIIRKAGGVDEETFMKMRKTRLINVETGKPIILPDTARGRKIRRIARKSAQHFRAALSHNKMMDYSLRQTAIRKPQMPPSIFSGDSSIKMWDNINNAKTIAELRMALYVVCCRIQDLESRLENHAYNDAKLPSTKFAADAVRSWSTDKFP